MPTDERVPGRIAVSTAPEGWARLQSLFEEVLDLPAERRAPWLVEHVEDEELRGKVSRLISSHEREGPFDALTGALATFGAGGGRSDEVPARIGAYRVERLLGEGGTARVYAALHDGHSSAARVAIKVLRAEADSERVRRRFLAEREIVAGLHHPGIARFLDAGFTPEGDPYLVTEFVDGRPIDRYVKEEEPTEEARISLFLQVCDAVEAAHAVGVVHRDLKPGNVLVDGEGRARLLDFGIAKVLEDAAFPELRRNTSAGVRLLTFRYASPEQLRGEAITPASDVYQLGLLLYRMLSGRLPRISSKFVEGPATRPPRAHGDGAHTELPDPLEPVVARALASNPADRHGSAGALAAAVRRAFDAPRPAATVADRLRSWLGLTPP